MALMLSMTALSVEALSEHDLIDAARDGDDRAFEELYARFRERIGGFIHARVRDHGRAEDIAQEVFISALRRLRASDQPIAFKPWIYEIAKNACIDEFRRVRRVREVSARAGRRRSRRSAPAAFARPHARAAVETKQRLTDLRGAFGGLSESHHRLLVMRELEGLSYDEIGARTGDVAPDGRERPVPRPAQAQRGIRGARQRSALPAGPVRDRGRPRADPCARSGFASVGSSPATSPTARPAGSAPTSLASTSRWSAAAHRRQDRRPAAVPALALAVERRPRRAMWGFPPGSSS